MFFFLALDTPLKAQEAREFLPRFFKLAHQAYAADEHLIIQTNWFDARLWGFEPSAVDLYGDADLVAFYTKTGRRTFKHPLPMNALEKLAKVNLFEFREEGALIAKSR